MLVIKALMGLGGLYLLVIGAIALFQRDMIYHPGTTRSQPDEAGVPEMVPVPLKAADGWIATSWYSPPKNPQRGATVVLFHGNAGTLAGRAFKARAFLDAGYGVFLAEYRGYGGNAGQPSEKGLYADAEAIIRWLTGQGVPASKLILYGESLGSGVAMEMATRTLPMMVVLECPFTRLPDLAPAYVIPPLAHLLMVDRYDNLAKVRDLTAPLLVVHGERDPLVPVAMGHALLSAADTIKEGVFLPNGHHNDLWDHGAGPRILDFIARRMA